MRQTVSSDSPWEEEVGYSRAVRVGSTIHVAGTAAVKADGTTVAPGDAYAQTAYILGTIKAALRQVGASAADVVRTRIYVSDIEDWQAVGRAHREVFGAVGPASTMVQVAALIRPEMVVEIEAEAIVEDDSLNA